MRHFKIRAVAVSMPNQLAYSSFSIVHLSMTHQRQRNSLFHIFISRTKNARKLTLNPAIYSKTSFKAIDCAIHNLQNTIYLQI